MLQLSAVVLGLFFPVSQEVDLQELLRRGIKPDQVAVELVSADGRSRFRVPAQFVPHTPKAASGEAEGKAASKGTLWWIAPAECAAGSVAIVPWDRPALPQVTIKSDPSGAYYDLAEGNFPVLRYNHGTVPVPEGVNPKYARGDYIHPLYGLDGERLTDDYPRDHPHHRAVGWSWPVTRWKNEVRDIWAVSGVWSRPVAVRRTEAGPVLAILEVENVWKWGDKDPIVREEVAIRAYRRWQAGRFVDVEVRLTGLAESVAIGGRPHAGYGGFGLRAAPVKNQKITLHVGPAQADPRRAWIDYSGVFAGAKGLGGVTIFENVRNPGYPSDLKQYPNLNYVMPAFPGEREVPLPPGKTLVLNHRLFIHAGGADEKTLSAVWAAYAKPAMPPRPW